jgi:hypothetical protein
MHYCRASLSLIVLLALVLPVTAQTLYVPSGTSGIGSSSNGNVGVGTSNPPYSFYTSGDIGVPSNRQFIARYDNNENYKATFGWSHLQLGNNGSNWIVAGRTAAGGALSFIVNNTADYSYGGFNGIEAMTIAANGSVGIGTASPASKLHIVASANHVVAIYNPSAASGITDFSVGGIGWVFARPSDGSLAQAIYSYNSATKDNLAISARSDIVFTAGEGGPSGAPERMRITDNGNVGIGTSNPASKLSISNGSYLGFQYAADNGTAFFIRANSSNAGELVTSGYSTPIKIDASNIQINANGGTGNVGIGTTNPSHKLSVNGAIRAKEVIVDTGWSDYVFDKDYRLTSLDEVERAIEKDGHLPGIPSAQEVAEHGVNMGEMQSKLLAKVEELTLHLIVQEKEIRRLREQLNSVSR